jgi:hypothetical protein
MTAKNLLPYGVSGLFIDRNDVHAHGRDERLLVKLSTRATSSCIG